MAQRITVNIAGHDYVFNAPTPQSEEMIRLAAAQIGKKISGYLAKFPGKNMVDILSFVALNESISSLTLQRKLEAVQGECDELAKATDIYLENTEI